MHMEIQEKSVPWYAHRGKQIILLLILLCLVLICGCSNKSSNTPIASEKGVYSDFLYVNEDSSITITGFTGHGETVSIPSDIGGYLVKAIDNEVFKERTEIVNFIIPDTVSHIGFDAFKGTKWYDELDDEYVIVGDGVLIKYNGLEKDVLIPTSVKNISACAFKERNDILTVELHKGITGIPDYCFYNCSKLTDVYTTEQIESIGESSFEGTYIYEFEIPEAVNEVSRKTFYNCVNLNRVVLHNGIVKISDQAFGQCSSLDEVNVKGYQNVQMDYQYGLKSSIVLPRSIKSIGENVFEGCSSIKNLSTIHIKEGIKNIEKEGFIYIEKPGYVYIPKSVTHIDEGMFNDYPDIALMVYENSYAKEYAKNNSYSYYIRPSDFTGSQFEKILRTGFNALGWEFTYENMLKVESIIIYPYFALSDDIENAYYNIAINSDNFIAYVENDGVTKIESLEDLKYFSNLNSLEIRSYTGISDLGFILSCPFLSTLSINNSKISDIGIVTQLEELKVLSLDNNPIKDFTPIQQLKDLEFLSLEENGIKNLVFLSDLTKLEFLSLKHNEIEDVSPLSVLHNLKYLYLDDNNIHDISSLKDLITTKITVTDNPID